MNTLQSISEIIEVKDTQRRPVVVLCDDSNRYLCKHTNGVPANYLFNEFLSSRFLAKWGIPYLEPYIVYIKPTHVPPRFLKRLHSEDFRIPCIGYQYLPSCTEITEFHSGLKRMPGERRKFPNKDVLFNIAMFDLWLANEDRHEGNYNLLIQEKDEEYNIIPIDHEMIFNSNTLENNNLGLLTGEETLFLSKVFNAFVGRRRRNEILQEWRKVEELFYLRVQMCQDDIELIFNDLPSEWRVDVQRKKELLLGSIFSRKWCKDVLLNAQFYLNK